MTSAPEIPGSGPRPTFFDAVGQGVRRLLRRYKTTRRAVRAVVLAEWRRWDIARRNRRVLRAWARRPAEALDRLSGPLYSFVLLSRAEDLHAVRQTLRSLARQVYRDWELILVVEPDTLAAARDLSGEELWSRAVHVVGAEPSASPAAALNLGLAEARGEWIGFLEAGDSLTPESLLWMRCTSADRPAARWLYSDEGPGPAWGRAWCFKPDFSPEHLLSRFFTGNLAVYDRGAIREAGGLRESSGTACLYDLCLRLSERLSSRQIAHVPYALFHRRRPSRGLMFQETLTEERMAAVREALSRRQLDAVVERQEFASTMPRIRLRCAARPHVAIIIATRNHVDLVRACVTSARQTAGYLPYDIIVIDNQSDDPELLSYLAEQSRAGALRVHRYPQPFNHSAMHNEVVAGLTSKYVVLLNNDVWDFSVGWLEELVGTAESDESIGAVGAKLTYPDDTIQHAGILVGIRGCAAHSHVNLPQTSDGYFGRVHALQEYTAVTAALVLMRREAYAGVGGFDAETFPTSYNDVDLCLRLRNAGYRCIYNPSVRARHFESKTRGRSPLEQTYRDRLRQRWGERLCADPFYNPNLSANEQFRPGLTRVSCEDLAARLRTL